MVAKKITSLQHPLVLECVRLREDHHYREKKGLVLVVGQRMVQEVAIDTLITTEECPEFDAKNSYFVSEAVLKKITGLSHPDGYAALLPLPLPQDVSQKQFLVVLDQIQDPGNLGTLLRTVLALNWDGVIVTPGTVDLFNDKALRAAKGAHFFLPYARMTRDEVAQMNLHFYMADLEGEDLDEIVFQKPRAVILSHEARGADLWSDLMAQKVTIPMNPDTESLNVAISGAIILYHMRPL